VQGEGTRWRELRVHRLAEQDCTLITLVHADLRSPVTVHALESEFAAVVAELRDKRVVLDFSGVSVAPTAIFGIVLKFVADAREQAITVRICQLAQPIRRAFDLLNAKGLVSVYPSRKDAVLSSWERRGWWPFG